MSKFVRAWWPELLIGGCLGLFALWGAAEAVGAYMAASHLAMTKDADVVLASGYTLAILALGWGLCARHRRLPLEERFDDLADQVDGVGESMGRVEDHLLGRRPGRKLRLLK